MSSRKTTIEQRIADYNDLAPVQKAIVRLLAINVDYCRVKGMLACLADLGITDPETNTPYNTLSIQPLQNELIKQGLLLKANRGVCCPESIQVTAIKDCLLEGLFPDMAHVLTRNLKITKASSKKIPFMNAQQIIRSILIELFSGQSMEEISILFFFAQKDFSINPISGDNLLVQLLTNPFSLQIIEKIDPAIRFPALIRLLKESEWHLEPGAELCNYIETVYGSQLPGTSEALPLVAYYFACGDTDKARSLIGTFKDRVKAELLSRSGWLEFISGNYEQALRYFDDNLKAARKITGQGKIFLQSTVGPIHLLALLQSRDDKRFKEALGYIDIAKKQSFALSPLMEVQRSVFLDQMGLEDKDSAISCMLNYEDDPILFLILNLCLAWTDKIRAKDNHLEIGRMRDKALQNGYNWLAAELSALLAYLGKEKMKNQKLAASLHKKCNTVSCINIVQPMQKWEKTLNGLLTMRAGKGADNTDKNAATEQRLIWLFSHNEYHNFCSVSPKMQKMSKKGRWTKGRPVALTNLYKNFATLEGLTDQDRRVCQGINEEHYKTSWRYGKTEYEFNDDVVLPALVGHPLLFLGESTGPVVELVLSEPELQIREERGKLRLSLFPMPATDELQVVKDTPTRFKIIRFTKEHKKILSFLGKGISIPKSGENKVRQVVDSLASMVTVHSDLALDTASTAKVTTRKADSRPHAHIIPWQEGIQVDLLVKPCGAGGSSFRPGRGGKTVLTEIEGEKIQAVRNFSREKKQQTAVIHSCPTLNRIEQMENQWQMEDPEDALELLLELKECGDDVVLEWPHGEKMVVRREISGSAFAINIKKERDWFKATGKLTIDDSVSLDLRRLLEMLGQSNNRFIELDDGTFLAITRQLRNRLADLEAFSESHGKGVRFSPLAALALEDLTEEAGQLRTDKAWKSHCKKLQEVVEPDIPSTLQGSLRDYQKTGFNWLAQLSHWGVGACLADDMGLGKTIQALAAILLRAGQGPTLVVAPLSVTSNWQEEAARFAPTLNVILFGSGDRKQMIDDLKPFDLMIVSYGLLPLESELLTSVAWQTVVLDEAQAIKNMQTKRSKAAMQLQAGFRIITSGTPMENHLGELWTLFNFLNPGLLGSYKKFNEKFAAPIERDQDTEKRNQLRKLIRPFILRRLKSDVLQELPPKTEITLEVEMSKEELVLYEAQRIKALENISGHDEEGAGQQHLRILAEIMKLRRLCCNPSLVLPECGINSSKLKVFADTVDELLANNHKALVFSQFVGHLEIIRNYLDLKKISYQYLDGSTPIKKRKERINSFQNGEGDLFLISLKAGGAGLNLTAADYVIHMDPWWNPAVEDQASDRVHRIGQERPVTVYRLVMKDSIEEQIVDLHKQKRDLANSLLEGTDSAGKVSARELLGLLQGEG